MQYEIKKYPVQHPLLKKYIKFFWELHIENIRINHKIIPQRNINLRFNLNDTPQYLCENKNEHKLEEVFFSGLQEHYLNAHLKMNGKVDVLGICFLPDGFYPFLKIPVNEFKNLLLGAREVNFNRAGEICERLKEAADTAQRLSILESELLLLIDSINPALENFQKLFNAIKQNSSLIQLTGFCKNNNISMRTLERMFNKYVGVSAKSFVTLDRFQNGMNKILYNDYSKLSDIAYGSGYFDQMHFIKEFKRFAGGTPKSFIRQNNSILQIGKLKTAVI